MAAEHVDLLGNDPRIITLIKTRGKQPMPEEGHFLLQRALRGGHAIHPANLCPIELKRLLGIDVIPLQEIFLDLWSGLGMEQRLDGGLIASRQRRFQFVAWGTKAGATEQVGHKLQISERHISSLSRRVRSRLLEHFL